MLRCARACRRGAPKKNALRAQANELRSEQATAAGRRDSLEALIRDHSYSTDTVRKLLKPGALAEGMAPVGTLADFLEVSGEHEGVVDEFLREELNYVVVRELGRGRRRRAAAEVRRRWARDLPDSRCRAGRCCSKNAVKTINGPGVTPLKDAIRVLNGFGRSLEAILPKLRHGYLVEDATRRAAAGQRHTAMRSS